MEETIIFPHLNIRLDSLGRSISIGDFEIAYYGMVIALGMLLAVSLICYMAKKDGIKEDDILDICIFTIIFGIIGARIYYVLFSWDYYQDNLSHIFKLREGGLAIYGGVLAGILTVFIICKIKKLNFLQVIDIMFFGVLIGQILGRFGNFFNREVFGGYTDSTFAMLIPKIAVRDPSDITQEMLNNLVLIDGTEFISVHPTFLYESLWNLGVLILMFVIYKHKQFYGQNFIIYLIGYGVGRFWIEGIRTDQLYVPGTKVPVSQVVAIILIVVGITLWYILSKNKKRIINEK